MNKQNKEIKVIKPSEAALNSYEDITKQEMRELRKMSAQKSLEIGFKLMEFCK